MKYVIFLLFVFTILSCKDKVKSAPMEPIADTRIATINDTNTGKRLLETECYTCHNPKADEASMIAPPMFAIKKHYIDENTTKEAFTQDLIRWINDPEAETKMPDAQRRFGKMPYMPYPDDEVAQMAAYLYDNEVEKPDWFDAHFKKEHANGKGIGRGLGKGKGSGNGKNRQVDTPQDPYAKTGMQYALAAKGALGKNLMKAIQEKGTGGALEFCNVKALPLTDSIAQLKNAKIKRVSDKPRNPGNTANTEELGYISYFKGLIASGIEPKPIVKEARGEVQFYFPITTNAMCLQCHGTPNEQVQPATMAKLQELYPTDKALGYDTNEVRGIWAIVFDKENQK
ncbi:DUF3365 domain-containing protein [Maribacter chungangensis]|uniref:DUF3365 domain-containing protein n=1 Tax=Maribacter chungangensis TaxID=1069117 RepID=A0ABW3B1X0_9FLAO